MTCTRTDLVLTIEGGRLDDIAGFHDKINRVFMTGEDWRLGASLDAPNDMLHGDFGATEGARTVRPHCCDRDESHHDLGVAAMHEWWSAKLRDPAWFNAKNARAQIAALEQGRSETLLDMVMEILTSHARIDLACDQPPEKADSL